MDFSRRSPRDVVTSTHLPDDTVITVKANNQITLSAPWAGPSGVALLGFHNDMHNYAVQFFLPVN